jgi:glycosyltransferase involved in cell wall biosynthesis
MSGPPLRVLHVINSLGLGGAEQVLVNLVAHRGAGVSCAVARLGGPGDLDAAVAATGAEVHALGEGGARGSPGAALRLFALVRRLRPDLLHTHLMRSEIVGGALGALLGVPVIGTVHNVAWRDPALYGPLARSVYAAALRRNDHTVAVAEAVAVPVRQAGVAPRRLSVIANGIPTVARLPRAQARRRLGLPEGDWFVVGAVGNLHRYKAHDVLLEAAARLRPARPDLRVVIVGSAAHTADEAQPEALRQRARRLGLEDRLHLTGAIAGAAALLDAFDLYAQPSRTEGASIALLEALAAGLPVVASTAGGTPSVIGDSGGAVLVPPDDVAALADALGHLAASEAARAELSARGLALGARYTAPAMTAAYEDVYRAVTAGRR